MAFAASFTVKQSADGATVTLTDSTNYGDGGSFHKADFVSRTLYRTRGDTLVEETLTFPYTNTNDSIQDTYVWTIDQDYVYSIRMVLVDNGTVTYTYTSPVVTTEFTNKKLRQLLSTVSTCGCNDNCSITQRIQCGLDAATARTCAGDISEAQQIIFDINEVADNKINC
jgi:hypothetical protein